MAENTGYSGYQGYGGYGQAMDPASIRARLAMAMLQQGSDSSPIRSPWQGAARMSQALFGALMLRQQQDEYAKSWQGLGPPPGGGQGSAPAAAAAPPNTLSNFAQNPAMVADVFKNLPPDTFAGAGGEMGPPQPTMAPNNSAGGLNVPGYIGGSSAPGGSNSGGPPPANMTAALPASMQHNMQVAGPGAPSQVSPLPPSGPASGNGPQGADAGGPVPFNPSELAPFQRDVQGFAGTSPPNGGGGGGVLDQLKANIAGTESRGQPNNGYGAIGPTTNGDRPYGKYQVMGNNIPQWTQAALGQAMTPQQFLASPQAQEAVVNHRLGGYLQQYGPAGAARAWFTGSPTGAGSDINGMTGDQYAARATQGLGSAGPSAMAFNGGQPPPPSSPALGAIQGAAGPGGGLAAPPGSLQPNMMVAGPGVPSGARGGAPPPMPPPGAMGPPPNGGGNPFSAIGSGLQNMFGLGNPSSPQGGPSPAPAGGPGGGAPSGAMDAYRQRLMQVMANPYADPKAKEWAMQLMQLYGPHPMTWEPMPGTNNLYQKDFWGNFTGQIMPGPHQTSVVDAGTDFMGVKHQGVFDKDAPLGQQITVIDPTTGQPRSVTPGQGGGAPTGSSVTPGAPNSVPPGNIPPPNPAWTPGGLQGSQGAPAKVWSPGQPLDQGVDARLQGLAAQYAGNDPRAQGMVYQYAKALLQGNQQFVTTGAVAKAPYIEAAETIARQIDPDGMPQTRFDTIKQNADTSSPTALGGQRMAAQTSVRHLGSLATASDLLANQGQVSSSEMAAELQNWAQRNLGGASSKFTDASQAYNAALVPVLGEIDKLYKGGQATEGEIMEMKSNLAPTASPDARRAALTMLGGLLQDKVQVLQDTWHMGAGKSFPDLPIIDQRGQEGLDYIKKWGAGGGQGQPAPNPGAGGAQAAPAPGPNYGPRHAGGTPTGPIIVESQSDYDALPTGAKYSSGGKTYVKGK